MTIPKPYRNMSKTDCAGWQHWRFEVKNMAYIITRQAETEGYGFIEVTYDKGFIGKNALKKKYTGEFEDFDDPRAAVETAILIRGLWQREEPDLMIGYGFGSTIDQSVAAHATYDAEKLRKWALDRVRSFPFCEWCDGIIYKPDDIYSYKDYPGVVFCCKAHGAEWLDDKEATEAAIDAEAELDHAEQATRRDIEFADEHRQNV